jgi:cyanophycinase
MPIRPVWGHTVGPAPRKYQFRLFAYGVILAGAGVVATLCANLALLATASSPEATVRAQPVAGHGALVICGGGGIPDTVRTRFLELAGGMNARIVVIPTAHRSADGPGAEMALDSWKKHRLASIQLFHTRSREVANDAEFVRPLSEATGVWFDGGLQSLLTEAYLGTEVERQLKALLDRGGVIGGTSAGAAVMSRVMIAGGRTKPDVREGFDFLPGVVIDQHFLRRNRLTRLLSVLSEHPDLIGLGIDERTALVVNLKSHLLNVLGDSYVVACVPGTPGQAARLAILKPGDETNLTALKESEDPSLAIAPALSFESL